MSLFCDHDWQPRTGMDSGSYCVHCKQISDREVKKLSSGLTNGTLQTRIEAFRQKNQEINIHEKPKDSFMEKLKKSFF